MRNSDPRRRLIFALDVGGSIGDAVSWVDRLKDHVGMFKVGKESFTAFGPEIVSLIRKRGGEVFLDLKFHDIPHTVSQAAIAAGRLGVSMLNIHAMGGRKMMEETVAAVKKWTEERGEDMPLILAVTVLTSLSDDHLKVLGFGVSAHALALRLARLAHDAGISGVVSSPIDISEIRESCGDNFIIVAPGIRGAREVRDDDQKRVMTAADALAMGADYIVVGRPIRMAPDPEHEADEIVREIARGLAMRGNAASESARVVTCK